MKSNSVSTLIGIAALSVVISVVSAGLLSNDVLYKNVNINYVKLQTLVNTKNLNTLYLQNKYVKTGSITRRDYVTLIAVAYDIDGKEINTDGLLVDENSGNVFPKTKIFANYIANKPQIDSLLHLTGVTYFKLNAKNFTNPDYTYYNINLFPTPSGGTGSKAFLRLNPCPPACKSLVN